MNKTDLIKSLQNDKRSDKLCREVVNSTFELLSSMVNLEKSLNIDTIGMFDAHHRKGVEQELSVFFHPSASVKNRVKTLVEDAQQD